MKYLIKPYLFLAALLLSSSVIAQTTPNYGIRVKNSEITAFRNANIQVTPDLLLENASMVIRNGLVESVGTNIKIPADATVIDLDGKFIFPGFIDAFTEYGLGKKEKKKRRDRSAGPKYQADRQGGDSWNDAIHASANHVESFKPDSKQAKAFHEIGFTTVQSAKLDGIFRGRSFVALLGEGLSNDMVLRPYSHHFLSFNKGSSKQWYPSSLMGSIALIRQTFLDADWYSKAQAAIKKNPNQEMPEFNRECKVVAEVIHNNETFVFETSNKLSLLRANRIATEFGRSFIYIGSGHEYERINDIAAISAKIILPINYPKTPEVGSFEDELDVSLASLRHWETAPSNPYILEERNITFALTTYGLKKKKDFLSNLRKAVKRGLSKKTALASLTTVPAELCGIEQFTGTLEKGKLANFSIWDKEIFEKKAKIYSVWVAGQKHELKPIPEHEFKGEYALDIDGVDFELEISGKPEKPSGTLELGEEKEYKLKNVEVQGPKLMFSVKLDTLALIGTFRFSGRIKDSSYVGKFTRPDGTRQDFVAVPAEKSAENEADDAADSTDSENGVEDKEEDKQHKKKSDDENDESDVNDEEEELLAKLTFPNRAYGLETLPQQENVLIKNATIWTSEAAGILENYDLLIKDGKFAALGENLKAPAGVPEIDATGKHITAGMIDEHSHIAISGGVNECTDAVTCEVRIGDVINSDDLNIYRQLAGGTTTAQLLHGSCNPIGGQAQIIKHRWGSSTEEMKFKDAPPTVKFALGENVKHSNFGDKFTVRYPQTRMGVETLIKDECQAAKEYDADWAAYNKLSKGAKKRTVPPRRDLELEAMSDIVNSRMFIHCHSYHQSEILMLMRVAEEHGFHVQTFTHILEGYKVAPEMAAHGATASTFADWWAYKFEVYDAIPYNMVLLTKAGVVTSINSDNGDLGRRLNQDAGKAVMYGGMSQEEAIKLATLNPAIQLKIDDRVGSIKVGKDADFVIWNNNPLSVYAKAEQTWVDGKKYFDLASDLLIRAAIKKEKQALIQKVLAKSDGKKKGDDKSKDHWGERNNIEDYQWRCDDNFDYWEKVNQ